MENGLRVSSNLCLAPNGNGSWTALNAVTGDSLILSVDDVILLANLTAGRVNIPAGAEGSAPSPGSGILSAQLQRLFVADVVGRDGTSPTHDRSSWPVFIIGAYRSGTTLLRYIVDAHPRLACPPESKFLSGVNALIDYPEAIEGLLLMGLRKEDIRYGLRQLIESYLSGYAASVGKPRWVDKTPNYYRLLPIIEEIFDRKVLYAIIVRHPLDTIDSLEHFFFDTARHHDPEVAAKTVAFGKGAYGWARFWTEVYDRASAFIAENPDRTHLIRYEELVHQPFEIARRLFEFLGESCPATVLEDAFRLPHTNGIQDPKIGSTTAVHTASVDKWKTWPWPRVNALWPLVETTAKKFGYELVAMAE